MIKETHTFAAEMLFLHGGGEISRRISSPSVKPRPKVGIGGVDRAGLGGEKPLGTSDAALGNAPFMEGLTGITAPPVFCSTLRKTYKVSSII